MPKYLVEATYTSEGAKGLLKGGGSARRKAVEDGMTATNGKLETFFFAFGDRDAIIIVDLPDNVSAAAISMAVKASGALHTRTTPLLTPEDIDEAARRHVAFRPPGE